MIKERGSFQGPLKKSIKNKKITPIVYRGLSSF